MGLATVYGIIQQSGGEIRVESELGTGSTFTIYLPQVSEDLPAPEAVVVNESLRGDETILLVEDSKTVRGLVLRYLENHGYTVIDAESGVEALRIAAAHPGRIDLLITDVVLPKIDGHELAMQLVEARPETAVIYSGPRRLVFVSLGEGRFEPREIGIGLKSDDYYEVESGLEAGEVVVVSANFLIAAESRLKSATGTW